MSKSVLITGITGQDGSYLADLLLEKGYDVYGLIRRLSTPNFWRIEHILDKITLIEGDMTDQTSLVKALKISQPEEVYNLAAQSFVGTSWTQPVLTGNINGLGVVRLLDAIHSINSDTKFYQASTSEMFGKIRESPQNENTPFYPRSPYGAAKVYAHWMCVNYRESYNMFICSGILFNHESPRRGIEFVTRKITDGVARIHLGLKDNITLGNLDAKRDWGFAKDYVEAMWLMFQQKSPDDFVIASGKNHSVKDLVRAAFDEIGISEWEKYVKTDPRFVRPADVDVLLGDYSKAKKILGWEPKISFEQMINIMSKSKMCLSFASNPNAKEGVTQMKGRTFEVLATGALLVAEYHEGLEDFVEENREAVFFRNKEELVIKLKKLLDKPAIASKLANQGFERYLREHTSKERMKKLLEWIETV